MKTLQFELPGGRRLAALRYGPETEHVVLFFHGTGFSGFAWQPDEQRLREHGYGMVVPHRPGIGASGVEAAGFTVEQVLQDLQVALAQLGVKSAYLLAQASGAAFAATFLRMQVLPVSGLGLINPVLPLTQRYAAQQTAHWRRIRYGLQYAPFLLQCSIQIRAYRIGRNPERWLRQSLHRHAVSDQMLYEQLQYRVAMMEDIRNAYLHAGAGVWHDLRALYNFDWDLTGYQLPIDIWQGKEDHPGAVSGAAAIGACNPGIRLHILPHAGTWLGLQPNWAGPEMRWR